MKVRKVPMRQCVGCREHKEKKELLRVLRTQEGEVVLDLTGKKNGRGAYLCPKKECLLRAKRAKALERSLEVSIPEEVYERLGQELAGLEEQKPDDRG